MRSLILKYILGVLLLTSVRGYTLPDKSNDYVMMTMPKSGTHLLSKLLRMLSKNPCVSLVQVPEFGDDRRRFPPHRFATVEAFLRLFPGNPKRCLMGHLNYSNQLRAFFEHHPEYAKILMIRDLRDICVSTTFFINDGLTAVLGPLASFDDKLLYVIKGEGILENSVFNVAKMAREALQWTRDPTVHVCRFETLIGAKGKGSKDEQEEEIVAIANALGVAVSQSDLDEIVEHLFGNTATFRRGQIGDWRKHFKSHHIIEFKKRLGRLLVSLGYEISNNHW